MNEIYVFLHITPTDVHMFMFSDAELKKDLHLHPELKRKDLFLRNERYEFIPRLMSFWRV